MRLERFFLATLFLIPAVVTAQSPRRVDDETAVWLAYVGSHPISPNWRLHLEGQFRQTEVVSQPQQRLFRTALLRVLNPVTRVGAGYAFNRSHPPEEFVANPQPTNEHRIYEQVDFNHGAGPTHIDHRYRLEQRWIHRPATATDDDEWTYTNRARYFLRVFAAPGGGSPSDGELYGVGYDEVFINFGENVRNNIFDQNRLFLGAGYRWSRALSVEAGYLYQLIVRANGTDIERNNTFVVTFSSSVPLRKF